MKYQRIIRAIRSTAWAIVPERLADIMDVMAFQAAGGKLTADEVREYVDLDARAARAEMVGGGGVQVLRLRGIVSHHIESVQDISGPGGTSVEGFRSDFRAAMADPKVSAVVIEVDSPGGSVEGVRELADEIRAARGEKPIVAVANTLMASAAYWIASSADEISVTPSGQVGSIGVFTAHSDLSGLHEKLGKQVTLVHAGKYKVEGHPFGPLDEQAEAHLQAMVDEVYGQFISAVAAGRGVSADRVRAGYGEGRVVSAEVALAESMVDRIETLEQAIARVQSGASPPGRQHALGPPEAFQFISSTGAA